MLKKTGAMLIVLYFWGQLAAPGLVWAGETCAGNSSVIETPITSQNCCDEVEAEPQAASGHCCGLPQDCRCHVSSHQPQDMPPVVLSSGSGPHHNSVRAEILTMVPGEIPAHQVLFSGVTRDWLPGPPLILTKSTLQI